jgi:hypothetical protein
MASLSGSSAAERLAESNDVLEVIFERCGLLCLDTLMRVCRLWRDLARAMPARWAMASIAGHLGDVSAEIGMCLRLIYLVTVGLLCLAQ